MSASTSPSLSHALIYSVFVRNHTQEGTFRALEADLERIAKLGADYIWLMPIHPSGVKGRKGSAGSPYAISDYRSTDPAYGTKEDFEHLVDAIHEHGMRCMIDVVYNHTSRDAHLIDEHPEFYWRDADGKLGNRVGDWSDVYDLDYSCEALWDYQIETLVGWAKIVDGFRCDVASFVPVEFWKKARAAVEEVHPGFVWLAESVHRSFGEAARAAGMGCATDGELFDAFDIEYSYDTFEAFERYLDGTDSLAHYLDLTSLQLSDLPAKAIKARYAENHDQPRIAGRLSEGAASRLSLYAQTVLPYVLPGTTLIYAGQEMGATHLPSLFDPDPVEWSPQTELTPLMQKLAELIHGPLAKTSACQLSVAPEDENVARIVRTGATLAVCCLLPMEGQSGLVSCEIPDGIYTNELDGVAYEVVSGQVALIGQPCVFVYDRRPAGSLG